MKLSPWLNQNQQSPQGERCLNSELWHACAGPLVSLPSVGSHVVYFPQGHSEQVAVSTNTEVDAQMPNYQSLPPQLICQLHNATMHADVETDEVYAQMTLQPLTAQEQKEVSFLPADLGAASKQPTNYFCKTLTASDTSTHGGFSVPRRAAEKVFPPLDFSQQPPAQELIARDLHNNEWKFRHIFRGQPKRHLLTTGWSVFASAKRLVAGDSVLFIWDEKNQLFLGIRRANRTQTIMPSSVLSGDSMHLGLLAAAAHAASTNSRFTVFYNPRASPSEFVIPLPKYIKAVYHTRVSVGIRFRMLFETEESSIRRYMGTITGISDSDPVRWPNSHWRSVKVGWDESSAGERQQRASLWEIEPLTTFPMYHSSPFPIRLKRPWPSSLPSFSGMQSPNQVTPWMQPRLDSSLIGMQNDIILSSIMQFQQPQASLMQPSMHHANLRQQQLLQQSSWPTKRVALDPLSNGQSRTISPPVDRLGLSNTNVATNSISLPPFPGRECLNDPQNRFLFEVNIDSSSLIMPNGSDYSLTPTVTSSSCIHDSGFVKAIDNEGQEIASNGTFVKVYKSGSFGRSLDITKFKSYTELRSELARMFGLEHELEDPLRSGWQLLFVDRENDILLLGDDPWQEFVNSVWCIKILSPQEVREMGNISCVSSL